MFTNSPIYAHVLLSIIGVHQNPMSLLDVNHEIICKHGDKIDYSDHVSGDPISPGDEEDEEDGGWGWLVVFASFMVHVLADGVTYSFGALATEFVSHFDASRESVGWMASILVGMTFSTGPFVSILCNKYGFRAVTMTGAIVSALGFAGPFFYSEFWFLYVSASVVTGIGFSLVYLPSIVTVSIYFQKKRAFAIGLAVCGSGIGTFIFSPLIEYFNETYGWQGSMLIVSGLILNCLACGAVYRPFPEEQQSISPLGSTRLSHRPSDKASCLNLTLNETEYLHGNLKYFTSVHNIRKNSQSHQESLLFRSAPDIHLIDPLDRRDVHKHRHRISHPHLLIPYHTTTTISPIERKQDLRQETVQCTSSTKSSFSSQKSKSGLLSCLGDIFDKELLRNPIFLLFASSNFFTSVGFNAPFLYAKDRALEMDVPNNYASFLISSIGIGNTLGRVMFGYLSTKSYVNRLQLYNGSLLLSGVVVIFSSFARTYPWMIIYTLAFGILTGTYVTLTSVVLVDLLGIDKLNSSFGMTMVFQGAAVFIGPPLAGWIFDKTNSFDCSFWVCGGFLAISGLMLYFVYCFKDYQNKITIICSGKLCDSI